MKTTLWSCTALLVLGGWTISTAQEPAARNVPNANNGTQERSFTVECQMVLVPAKAAIKLIPELMDHAKFAAAWDRVRGMVEREEATLSADLMGQGVENEKTAVESVEEIPYPTNFDPPATPATMPNDPPLTLEMLKNWPYVGIVPMTFQTRRVGQMLKLEVRSTPDARSIVATYEVQHVRLERNLKTDAGRLANGERLFIEQPVFSELSNKSVVVLESGKPKLVGVHRLPKTEETTYELYVLTVTLNSEKAP